VPSKSLDQARNFKVIKAGQHLVVPERPDTFSLIQSPVVLD